VMICNLDQNPISRPVVSSWLPALLRQGTMWRLNIGGGGEEERFLTPEESRCISVRSWPLMPHWLTDSFCRKFGNLLLVLSLNV
jgi:hypothetical protein